MVESLDAISQLPNLQDLKLADNELKGALPASITALEKLEVLEIQGNKLDRLPDSLRELVKLRVLNISSNCFSSLPIESLGRLPLVELIASRNKLSGALFHSDVTEMSRLQRLDIANNSLSYLSDSAELCLPSLRDLDMSFNRISSLPDMSSWSCLSTFAAEDNKLSSLPSGFTTLQTVKTINLTGNDFSRLDPNLGRMDGLVSLQIAANPIRESKFLSMNTEEIKRALRQRLEMPVVVDPLLEMMQSMGQS